MYIITVFRTLRVAYIAPFSRRIELNRCFDKPEVTSRVVRVLADVSKSRLVIESTGRRLRARMLCRVMQSSRRHHVSRVPRTLSRPSASIMYPLRVGIDHVTTSVVHFRFVVTVSFVPPARSGVFIYSRHPFPVRSVLFRIRRLSRHVFSRATVNRKKSFSCLDYRHFRSNSTSAADTDYFRVT